MGEAITRVSVEDVTNYPKKRAKHPKQGNGSNGNGKDAKDETTNVRLAKLESTVDYTRGDLSDIKTDARESRKDIGKIKTDLVSVTTQLPNLTTKADLVGSTSVMTETIAKTNSSVTSLEQNLKNSIDQTNKQ